MLIVLILSLAVQAINIAAMGLSRKNFKDFDDLLMINENMEDNKGYYNSVIAAAVISIVIFGFLIVVMGFGKSCMAKLDWLLLHGVIMLQFGIGTTLGVYLRNMKRTYNTAQDSYSTSTAQTKELLGRYLFTQINRRLPGNSCMLL